MTERDRHKQAGARLARHLPLNCEGFCDCNPYATYHGCQYRGLKRESPRQHTNGLAGAHIHAAPLMHSISRCVTQAGGERGALGDGVTVGDTRTTAAIGTGALGEQAICGVLLPRAERSGL